MVPKFDLTSFPTLLKKQRSPSLQTHGGRLGFGSRNFTTSESLDPGVSTDSLECTWTHLPPLNRSGSLRTCPRFRLIYETTPRSCSDPKRWGVFTSLELALSLRGQVSTGTVSQGYYYLTSQLWQSPTQISPLTYSTRGFDVTEDFSSRVVSLDGQWVDTRFRGETCLYVIGLGSPDVLCPGRPRTFSDLSTDSYFRQNWQ